MLSTPRNDDDAAKGTGEKQAANPFDETDLRIGYRVAIRNVLLPMNSLRRGEETGGGERDVYRLFQNKTRGVDYNGLVVQEMPWESVNTKRVNTKRQE